MSLNILVALYIAGAAICLLVGAQMMISDIGSSRIHKIGARSVITCLIWPVWIIIGVIFLLKNGYRLLVEVNRIADWKNPL